MAANKQRRQDKTIGFPDPKYNPQKFDWVVETFGVKPGAPEVSTHDIEQAKLLLAAMTERQREVVLLRLNNLSEREIAEMLGVSQQTINVTFRRALERARHTLPIEGEWEDAALPKPIYDYYQRTGMSTGKKYTGEVREAMMKKALDRKSQGLSNDAIAGELNCSSFLVKELLIEAVHKGLSSAFGRTPK